MNQTIHEHEGKKYLRTIYPPAGTVPIVHTMSWTRPSGEVLEETVTGIHIDVYCVLRAFGVTDPEIAHAVKKLLCCGQRDKGDEIADLEGVLAAVNRALDEKKREKLIREAERRKAWKAVEVPPIESWGEGAKVYADD